MTHPFVTQSSLGLEASGRTFGMRSRTLSYTQRWAQWIVLALRLGSAALVWTYHVIPKLERFEEELHAFPDPLGWGSASSFLLALSVEGLGSLFVAAGYRTTWAAASLVCIMAAVLILGGLGEPNVDAQAAWLYALLYVAIAQLGPGLYSLDGMQLYAQRNRAPGHGALK